MKIAVIGCGYVGLVTGSCLAKLGHRVACIDNDAAKIEALRGGITSIHEPDLDLSLIELFTPQIEAVKQCDIAIIAVGTPSNEDGSCDLSQVFAVAEKLKGYKGIIVTKSTVPVGTNQKIAEITGGNVVSNPEFLREGSAVHDFLKPDRVVIGSDNIEHTLFVARLYLPLECEMVYTDWASAELIKYASNAFLAMKIAYINEMAWVAEKYGADIEDIAKGMALDARIGPSCLKVSPGYGGSCFPKDVKALRWELKLVDTTASSNWVHTLKCVDKITELLGTIKGKTIGILGTAFKAGTSDTRESAFLLMAKYLSKDGATIKTYDPLAPCTHTLEETLDSDAVVILTEWPEFRDIKHPCLIDFRNINPNAKYQLGRKCKSRPQSSTLETPDAIPCGTSPLISGLNGSASVQ